MKRIALVLALVLVASFAYAGDGDVAISDARGNKSILGDYNTTTKRIKTDTNGNLAVAGTGTAGTAAGGVLTVQGVASMTPVSVSGSVKIVDGDGDIVSVTGNKLDVNATVSMAENATVDLNKVAGTATAVNTGTVNDGTQRVVIATDQAQLTNALKVDGSAVTQPVSGTFWQTTQPVSATDLDIRDLSSVTDTISAVQSGTWNIGSVTTLPAITGSVTADTELPTAAELADNLANPTITALGSYNLVYDGSTWDRLRGDSTDGVLVNLGTNNDVTVTGTVTANAGTNLNTSALALEATLGKLTIAQDADLGTNTQALIGGSVTTAKPTYTTGKVQPLSLATDGTLRVQNDMNPCSNLGSGQKNITTAGTDEVLASSTSILSVTIKARSTNTGFIYVGVEGVSSTTGYILSASETVTADVDNLADVWLDASVNGEGVSYIYVIK